MITDRGVSEVIGFILIFAILTLTWTIMQVNAIDDNQNVEIEHNDAVQTDLLNLRDSILRTGTTGVSQSATIVMGADYPSRTIIKNFAVSGGFLEARDPAPARNNNITITNLSAIDSETADYINGTVEFSTKSIVYRPVYTHYQDAPETVIAGGGGAVFNQFDAVDLSIGSQVIINHRTITLVTIEGNLSKAKGGEGASVTVETEPLSVASNRVTVQNNTSTSRIKITLPTKIDNKTVWNKSTLAEEFGGNGKIHRITEGENTISIFLDRGGYSLRIMRVGIGAGTTDPTAHYLTAVDTPASSVSENGSSKIVVEVRDRYNNPIDGFLINATLEETDFSSGGDDGKLSVIGESESTSVVGGTVNSRSSEGRAEFEYTAPDVEPNTNTVNISISIFDGDHGRELVWVNTTVNDD